MNFYKVLETHGHPINMLRIIKRYNSSLDRGLSNHLIEARYH